MTQKFEMITRAKSPELDEMLGIPVQCLDHGFVRVVDYMGNQGSVVQAARVSYGEGTETKTKDEGLLRYLMRHWHTTPFEMCELKLHVKLPVFVARQWIRHRTANVNEMSARYSILPGEFYIPSAKNLAPQSTLNKQGRDGGYGLDDIMQILAQLESVGDIAYGTYTNLVGKEEDGGYELARELGRMVLPTNIYTEWYWKVDLHNLLHFLRLRADAHAQYEIRVYADVIANIVQQWVPAIWKAHLDYRVNAHTFSAQEMEVLRSLVSGTFPTDLVPEMVVSGVSLREQKAFLEAIGVEH